jgi:hypothetical protein
MSRSQVLINAVTGHVRAVSDTCEILLTFRSVEGFESAWRDFIRVRIDETAIPCYSLFCPNGQSIFKAIHPN